MLLAELAHGLCQNEREVVQFPVDLAEVQPQDDDLVALDRVLEEIGRASCRERVCT